VLAQLPFVSDPDIKTVADLNAHGIGENAYVYVPAACAGGETPCKLHIALHGCQQFPEWSFVGKVGDNYYTQAGRQMTMIYRMIVHFTGTPEERREGGSPK